MQAYSMTKHCTCRYVLGLNKWTVHMQARTNTIQCTCRYVLGLNNGHAGTFCDWTWTSEQGTCRHVLRLNNAHAGMYYDWTSEQCTCRHVLHCMTIDWTPPISDVIIELKKLYNFFLFLLCSFKLIIDSWWSFWAWWMTVGHPVLARSVGWPQYRWLQYMP